MKDDFRQKNTLHHLTNSRSDSRLFSKSRNSIEQLEINIKIYYFYEWKCWITVACAERHGGRTMGKQREGGKARQRTAKQCCRLRDHTNKCSAVPAWVWCFYLLLEFFIPFLLFFFSQFLFSPQTLRSFHFFWKILFLVLFGFLISAMCSSALIGCVDPSIQRSVPGARARVVGFVASVLLSILLTWFMMLKGKVVNSFDCSIL